MITELHTDGPHRELDIYNGPQPLSADDATRVAQEHGAPADVHKWSKQDGRVWTLYWQEAQREVQP